MQGGFAEVSATEVKGSVLITDTEDLKGYSKSSERQIDVLIIASLG